MTEDDKVSFAFMAQWLAFKAVAELMACWKLLIALQLFLPLVATDSISRTTVWSQGKLVASHLLAVQNVSILECGRLAHETAERLAILTFISYHSIGRQCVLHRQDASCIRLNTSEQGWEIYGTFRKREGIGKMLYKKLFNV